MTRKRVDRLLIGGGRVAQVWETAADLTQLSTACRVATATAATTPPSQTTANINGSIDYVIVFGFMATVMKD